MPFNPQILDDLAAAGSNIVITVTPTNLQLVTLVVNLWVRFTGTVTMRNASLLPPNNAVAFARALGGRLTLEE